MQMFKKLMMVCAVALATVSSAEAGRPGKKATDAIQQVLRFDTILSSTDRIAFANALAARSAAGFRAGILKAAKQQKINVVLWKALLGTAPLWGAAIPQVEGKENYAVGKGIADGLSEANAITKASLGTFVLAAPFAAALAVPHWKRAQRRVKMYMDFAANADMLYALLSDESFKRRMGVIDWDTVSRCRKKAEFVSLGASIGTSVGLFALGMMSDVQGSPLGLLSSWIMKPLIAKAMRKKDGAPELEAEFIRAIQAQESGQPFAFKLQPNTAAVNNSVVSSAPVTPVVHESARDKYLRMIAEKRAQQESEAVDAEPTV